MRDFDEFKNLFLDYRLKAGDKEDLTQAFWMSHAYELASLDGDQRAKAVVFKGEVSDLINAKGAAK